jgi:hypothetical protein
MTGYDANIGNARIPAELRDKLRANLASLCATHETMLANTNVRLFSNGTPSPYTTADIEAFEAQILAILNDPNASYDQLAAAISGFNGSQEPYYTPGNVVDAFLMNAGILNADRTQIHGAELLSLLGSSTFGFGTNLEFQARQNLLRADILGVVATNPGVSLTLRPEIMQDLFVAFLDNPNNFGDRETAARFFGVTPNQLANEEWRSTTRAALMADPQTIEWHFPPSDISTMTPELLDRLDLYFDGSHEVGGRAYLNTFLPENAQIATGWPYHNEGEILQQHRTSLFVPIGLDDHGQPNRIVSHVIRDLTDNPTYFAGMNDTGESLPLGSVYNMIPTLGDMPLAVAAQQPLLTAIDTLGADGGFDPQILQQLRNAIVAEFSRPGSYESLAEIIRNFQPSSVTNHLMSHITSQGTSIPSLAFLTGDGLLNALDAAATDSDLTSMAQQQLMESRILNGQRLSQNIGLALQPDVMEYLFIEWLRNEPARGYGNDSDVARFFGVEGFDLLDSRDQRWELARQIESGEIDWTFPASNVFGAMPAQIQNHLFGLMENQEFMSRFSNPEFVVDESHPWQSNVYGGGIIGQQQWASLFVPVSYSPDGRAQNIVTATAEYNFGGQNGEVLDQIYNISGIPIQDMSGLDNLIYTGNSHNPSAEIIATFSNPSIASNYWIDVDWSRERLDELNNFLDANPGNNPAGPSWNTAEWGTDRYEQARAILEAMVNNGDLPTVQEMLSNPVLATFLMEHAQSGYDVDRAGDNRDRTQAYTSFEDMLLQNSLSRSNLSTMGGMQLLMENGFGTIGGNDTLGIDQDNPNLESGIEMAVDLLSGYFSDADHTITEQEAMSMTDLVPTAVQNAAQNDPMDDLQR